ncbi:LysE family translocator [Pseudoalteromonas denitrificans]|uniref:Threonine/homoserine/homoserine lactone efflux protein n=1 Tax=Pseudoalteromonas denitrificans DSM 6059 TaxID=1123010 RepID=A0A1I1E398_9GAMM|nr:LysE family translocator [Pseudoalteromonas denitrificans]SFB81126.1 Threonine/homoserine/homoserine lactone efflux protein [Pseudoalteromonas denitrificans DSM 6059]
MNTELISLILPISIFSIIATITPGPNNILLAHSGAHFGIKKTLPHVMGIRLGMISLQATILFGLGNLFKAIPSLQVILSMLATSYIIMLAIKISRSQPPSLDNKQQPMSIVQAACFQLINPKSWAMLLTASSIFTLTGDLFWPSAILSILLFNTVSIPCAFMWVTVGKMVSKKLQDPVFNKRFNFTMSGLLLLTIPMIFL